MDEKGLAFVASQRDKEIAERRFSQAFSVLLPGMQTSAIGAVPKPHSEKYRLITDQSAGPHALNSFISRDDAKVRYDTLQDLGRALRATKARFPGVPLVLWKSDVAHAFRTIPMHPLWQIRQVIEIEGLYHVDHCMAFGNRSSPVIWCRLAGLVAWIVINVRRLPFCHHYMDDFWSIEPGLTLIPYPRYGDERPHSQVQLLTLWDDLGIPHEAEKQPFGRCIPVVGFEVDTESMTFQMSRSDRDALVEHIGEFTRVPSRKHPLRAWQQMLGWCNWALNVFPECRPALASSYSKIAGKAFPHAPIFLNKQVITDLTWFAERLSASNGLSLVRGNDWDPSLADIVVICDACPSGMGFWSSSHRRAFYYRIPPEVNRSSNFCEAACLLSGLGWAISLPNLPIFARVLIYSDNLDACSVFASMTGRPPYYDMTLQAAAWILDKKVLFQTRHIQGVENRFADYLSRGMIEEAHSLDKSIPIAAFTPLPHIFPGKLISEIESV